MSTPHHPVGRRSAAVYRRRRLMVLLVLLAIIAVVLLIVLRPGSHADAKVGGAPSGAARVSPAATAKTSATPKPKSGATPSATRRATPKATPTPRTTPKASAAGQPCAPSAVDVQAITDASSYRAGARPLLSLSLTNTGTAMCTIDAGTATMVLTITSGRETYWTSTDCQTNPVHTLIKLEPGKTLTSVPIPWDRTRSSKTTCHAKTRPAAPAGGASYHLAVSIDGISASTTKQFLLY